MQFMKIDLIAGARPNFVKIASLIHAIQKSSIILDFRLIHTGQHYDEALSGNLFKQLKLPNPDINLGIGSGSQAEQTSSIMISYEKILKESKPDICLVVGDVTSSMACAVTAKKMQIKVAHVEAGLRSNDWTMPEEVNRVLIDSISDLFFTTTQEAADYLISCGKEKDIVHFVGNTMIDTLLRFRQDFRKPEIWFKLQLEPQAYLVLTMHRPGNVDEKNNFQNMLDQILKSSRGLPIIFPAHPRTASILKDLNCKAENLHIIPPLGYLEFNYIVENAKAVITDSGGITEEATVLGVPCLTLRENTERPETITIGSNEIIGRNPEKWKVAWEKIHKNNWKKSSIPDLWDGKAGKRIVDVFQNLSS